MEYSFIGDAVNTASRLEGLNKELNTSIIISHDIFSNLKTDNRQKEWKNLGEKALKGKEKSILVYAQ
jgi:adenylate cyclase